MNIITNSRTQTEFESTIVHQKAAGGEASPSREGVETSSKSFLYVYMLKTIHHIYRPQQEVLCFLFVETILHFWRLLPTLSQALTKTSPTFCANVLAFVL